MSVEAGPADSLLQQMEPELALHRPTLLAELVVPVIDLPMLDAVITGTESAVPNHSDCSPIASAHSSSCVKTSLFYGSNRRRSTNFPLVSIVVNADALPPGSRTVRKRRKPVRLND